MTSFPRSIRKPSPAAWKCAAVAALAALALTVPSGTVIAKAEGMPKIDQRYQALETFARGIFFLETMYVEPEKVKQEDMIINALKGIVERLDPHTMLMPKKAFEQLTIDTQKWASDVLVIKPTPQEAKVELARQINDRIRAAMEANLERQAEFDEDTSLFFNPKWQQWWSRKVEEELKQTHRELDDHKKNP